MPIINRKCLSDPGMGIIWGQWLLFEQTEKRTTSLSFIPNIKTVDLVFSEKIYQKFIFHYILFSKTSKIRNLNFPNTRLFEINLSTLE